MSKPVFIELGGNLGAGLTTASGEISKNLKVYRFSSDYIRNMFYLIYRGYTIDDFKYDNEKRLYEYLNKKYPNIRKLDDEQTRIKTVELYTKKEVLTILKELTKKKKSIVLDEHKKFGKKGKVRDFIMDTMTTNKYDKYSIYIDSKNKDVNRERVMSKSIDYNKQDDGVIGANINYSSSYANFDDIYPNNVISDKDIKKFNYIVDNNESINEFKENVNEVSFDIKSRSL